MRVLYVGFIVAFSVMLFVSAAWPAAWDTKVAAWKDDLPGAYAIRVGWEAYYNVLTGK